MKKVVVILPTYNGEKYLEELLDSIYNQSYPNIEIITRDDCSTDKTGSIILKYSKKKIKGRKITIIDNENKILKCPDCFIKLLEVAPVADYYCFCDQDDVWLPNKIEDAVKEIEKKSYKEPTLHFGSYDFCTFDLKFLYKSPSLKNESSLYQVAYDYWPLGFNITFNRALYDKVMKKRPKKIYYHDCWFAQVAAGVGNFICSNESTVKYRRQEGAVTYFNRNTLSLYLCRIKRFFTNDKKELLKLKRILKEYYKLYKKDLNNEDKNLLDILTNDNIKNYFKRIFFPKKLRQKIVDEIGLRLLFVLGML